MVDVVVVVVIVDVVVIVVGYRKDLFTPQEIYPTIYILGSVVFRQAKCCFHAFN